MILLNLQVLEMFGAGTACVISPIERIYYMGEHLMLPTMEHSNPFWKDMYNTLLDIQYGRIKHPWALEID
jgi:branched-chain amino acid aminotransferase